MQNSGTGIITMKTNIKILKKHIDIKLARVMLKQLNSLNELSLGIQSNDIITEFLLENTISSII